MKEPIDRNEFSGLMLCAFDHSIPGDKVKNTIYNNIIDECDNNASKRTAMQSIFFIRRMCILCVIVLASVIIAGSVILCVNVLQGERKPDGIQTGSIADPTNKPVDNNGKPDEEQNGNMVNNTSKPVTDAADNDVVITISPSEPETNKNQDSETATTRVNVDFSTSDSNHTITEEQSNPTVNEEANRGTVAKTEYNRQLISILRGSSKDFDLVYGTVCDNLANAFEKCKDKYVEKEDGNYKFTYLGMVTGINISSGQVDKTKENTCIAVRIENMNPDVNTNLYQFDIQAAIIVKDEKDCYYVNSSGYAEDMPLRAENGRVVYMVIDVTNDRRIFNKNPGLLLYASNESSDNENGSPYLEVDEKGKTYINNKTTSAHTIIPIMLESPNSNFISSDIDHINYVNNKDAVIKVSPIENNDERLDIVKLRDADAISHFGATHDSEVEIDGVSISSDRLPHLFENIELWWSNDKLVKVFAPFKKYTVSGENINDITYTLNQGFFCEMVPADADELDTSIDKGYIGHLKNNDYITSNNSDVVKPYIMLKPCGKSITVPNNMQNTSKYGIILMLDCNEFDEIDYFLSGNNVKRDEVVVAIANTKVDISVNRKNTNNVETKIELYPMFSGANFSSIIDNNYSSFTDGITK